MLRRGEGGGAQELSGLLPCCFREAFPLYLKESAAQGAPTKAQGRKESPLR